MAHFKHLYLMNILIVFNQSIEGQLFLFSAFRNKSPSKQPDGQSDLSKALKPRDKHCVRKTPLYHNATLEAPDGQLLCVCDIKKARYA